MKDLQLKAVFAMNLMFPRIALRLVLFLLSAGLLAPAGFCRGAPAGGGPGFAKTGTPTVSGGGALGGAGPLGGGVLCGAGSFGGGAEARA